MESTVLDLRSGRIIAGAHAETLPGDPLWPNNRDIRARAARSPAARVPGRARGRHHRDGQGRAIDKGGRPVKNLSDVIVYVDGPKAKGRSEHVRMVMKSKEFRPRVVAVTTGGVVDFPNQDPIFHNVFSVPGSTASTWTSTSGRKRERGPSRLPAWRGLLQHPSADERGSVVRDNPFFATAGADGSFTIETCPPASGGSGHGRSAPRGRRRDRVPARTERDRAAQLDASQWKRVRTRTSSARTTRRTRVLGRASGWASPRRSCSSSAC